MSEVLVVAENECRQSMASIVCGRMCAYVPYSVDFKIITSFCKLKGQDILQHSNTRCLGAD